MNKRISLITIAILLLIVAVLVIRGLREDSAEMASSDPKAGSKQSHSSGNGHDRSKKHGSGASVSTPLENHKAQSAEKFSSTVSAEIELGETLVMGGYLNEKNLHEFTMLTPSLVTMEDGSTMINIQSKVLNISPDFAHENGMNTLTTRYPTADQHAEAWSAEDLRSTLLKASSAEGITILAAPRVVSKPGQPATISLIGGAGQGQFAIEASVNTTARGGFSIQSRMVRTSPEGP